MISTPHRLWMSRLLLLVVFLVLVHSSIGHAMDFMAGVDISALPSLEAGGAEYSVGGVPGDAVEIFADNGANWARIRLFVDPSGFGVVDQDLPYTIALAQRVKAAGMNVLLDLHYSDTFADPGRQDKPAAWEDLRFAQLEDQVYDYTKDVVEQFDAAGAHPDMVQIGNEVSAGMLWPSGELWQGGADNGFDNFSILLAAGINGARDASPGNEPQIMIHHDSGANWPVVNAFFTNLLPRLQDRGADIDAIGLSYYPIYHPGGLSAVQTTLNNTVAAFDKPVAVVETGFASRGTESQTYEFEISEQGQKQFLQGLVDTVQAVPDEQGLGVFWWFPEAIPVSGVGGIFQGGRYSLFDANGNLLPAMDVFRNLTVVPEPSSLVMAVGLAGLLLGSRRRWQRRRAPG